MTMPFRWFTLFHFNGCYGYDLSPVGITFDQQSDWNASPLREQIMGDAKYASSRKTWQGIFKPKDKTYGAQTSMDNPALVRFRVTIHPPSLNTAGAATVYFNHGELADPAAPTTWDSGLAAGQTYDGVNAWALFPLRLNMDGGGYGTGFADQIVIANLPKICDVYAPAWSAATGNLKFPLYYDSWLRNGHMWRLSNYDVGDPSTWANGKEFNMNIDVNYCIVKYFNPVVNSMSRYNSPTAGGVQIVITGLGFHNSDADIEEGGDTNPGAWNDNVDKIHFIGLQGQGTTTINAPADFTVDSNTQITIPTMPALAAGTYEIKLEKNGHAVNAHAGDPISYAGDYSCDEDGLVYPAIRFSLLVIDAYDNVGPSDPPIILTKWRFKEFDGDYAFRTWSPIDIFCPSVFYDGRLKSISGLSRRINDDTGLYVSPDIQFEITNTDKELSKILATHYIKDEPIDIFLAFKDYPESFKTQVFKAFVEDIRRKGDLFTFDTRDVTTVYFNQKVPRYRITTDEFPNCHQNFVNKPMPEGLGLGSYIADEASGYMEAAYIDTTSYRFLAARGSLKSVDQVYKDGVLLALGTDYSITIADGGRTYIDLVADPESSKITFNFKGYIYAPWNSANGYVQHPVYILLFYLTLIMEMPIEYIDIDAFETVKDLLDSFDSGIATSGHLGIQEETNAETILKELILPLGVFFPDMRGRLKLMKKDITNIATSRYIYAQIDAFDHPEENWGLKEAVNNVKGVWNFAPAAGIYQSSKTAERTESIEAFCGHIQEDPNPMEMKWISSSILAEKLITETLYKRGSGRKTFNLDVHLTNISDLDIYTNFRLQDPFGVSASGRGYVGRYCYIEGIDYHWIENKMSIIARDLGYLLRAYLMLGSEDDHADNWSNASDEDKTFAYLCSEATGKFANGEKGKILVSESYMG